MFARLGCVGLFLKKLFFYCVNKIITLFLHYGMRTEVVFMRKAVRYEQCSNQKNIKYNH